MNTQVPGEVSQVVTVKVIIEGDTVQQVGYRLFLAQQALLSGIEHFYAANINNDQVHVLLNSDEKRVNRFYDTINKEKPEGVSTRSIKKEPYESDASIPSITTYLSLLSVDQLIKGREGITDLAKNTEAIGRNIENLGKSMEKVPDKIIDSFAERLRKSSESISKA